MKRTIYILLGTILIIFSCRKEEEVISPVASFEISKSKVLELEKVTFKITGSGGYYSFYTGDEGHEFEFKDSIGDNKSFGHGVDFSGEFSYTYKNTGVFIVVLIASSANGLSDTASKLITVEEDPSNVNISSISYAGIGSITLEQDGINRFFSIDSDGRLYNDTIIVRLPVYWRFVSSDGTPYNDVNQTSLIPSIFTLKNVNYEIEGVDDFINGITEVEHGSGTYYEPRTYSIISEGGIKSTYVVCPTQYSEFKSFKINNVEYVENFTDRSGAKINPTVTRGDLSNYSLTADISGTDFTSITPVWEVFNSVNTKVFIDGVEQIGNESHDFTNPVIYELVYTHPITGIISTSEITVTVK